MAQLFLEQVWVLTEAKFNVLLSVVEGAHPSYTVRDKGAKLEPTAGAIGILPIRGVISHRANIFTDSSGGTSTEQIGNGLDALMSNPDVGTIVLDIDSPGGAVSGVPELADKIYKARSKKNIVGVANAEAGSGAYWILSNCTTAVCLGSGMVGSIGALGIHTDKSKQNEAQGVKHTVIRAGKYKAEGAPGEPLTDEAMTNMQSIVNSFYEDFVTAVARGRDSTPAKVRNGMGEGRMVRAQDALSMGMIDKIGSMDDVLKEIAGKQAVANRQKQFRAQHASILGGLK